MLTCTVFSEKYVGEKKEQYWNISSPAFSHKIKYEKSYVLGVNDIFTGNLSYNIWGKNIKK
jgi:hypothetical protein